MYLGVNKLNNKFLWYLFENIKLIDPLRNRAIMIRATKIEVDDNFVTERKNEKNLQ